MKGIRLYLAIFGLAYAAVTSLPVHAQSSIDIPELNCGIGSIDNNCLVFDDFTVLSLQVLEEYQSPTFGLYPDLDFLAKPNEATAYIYQFGGNATKEQGAGTLIDDPYDSLTGSTPGDNGRFLMTTNSLTSGGPANELPSDPAGGPSGGNDNLYSDGTVVTSKTFTDQAKLYPNPDSKYSTDPIDSGLNPADPTTLGTACYDDIGTPGCMPLWDADLDAVRAQIEGDELILLFQLNDTGDAGTLLGQDLLAWAKVILTDVETDTTEEFIFSGNNTDFPSFQAVAQETGTPRPPTSQGDIIWDGTDILEKESDLWAYVHAEVCVEQADGPTKGAVFLGQCNLSGFTSPKQVNSALGADRAGFAVFNQDLSDMVLAENSIWDILTIDIRHAYLNNGGEQAWLASGQRVPVEDVPEPSKIALLGLGLTAFGLWRRRKARKLVH